MFFLWLAIGVGEVFLQLWLSSRGMGVLNRGVSFGIMEGWIETILIIGLLLVLTLKFREKGIGWSFFLLGGWVNLMTRLYLGGVWDYLRLPVVNLWFNLADVLIVLGTMGVIKQKYG